MRYLRKRRDKVERAWQSDRYSAREKASALYVLGDAVVLVAHPYDRDPASGAGNCWCGRHQSHKLHDIMDLGGLQADLADLERTDPNVRRASENYDRTVQDIVRRADGGNPQ